MNAHLYQARYSGGPCDGCVVTGTHDRKEDTWSMSVSTTDGKAGGHSTTEIRKAVYKLSRTCHLFDGGTPTIRYEYEFVGLEAAAPVTRKLVSGWLAFVFKRRKCSFQPSLWLPLPEGRPKRLGQVTALTCPSQGFPVTRQVSRFGTR